MKRLFFAFLICVVSMNSNAQIDSLLGVYDIDSCKFESNCNFVIVDTSQTNIWEVGSPSKFYFDAAYSPVNAISTRLSVPYDTTNHSSFELHIPNFMFSNMIVGFKHKFQTDSLIDGGYIEVSYDHGQSWINVIYDTNYVIYHTENFYYLQDTLKGGIPGFSGISAGWVHSRIQWVWAMLVKQYPPDTLFLRFNFISDDIQTNKDGWMIDDIVVSFADMPGSMSEKTDNNNVILFPNPFSDFTTINIENNNFEKLFLTLYDANGRLVKCEDISAKPIIKISKDHLKAGTYYLLLKSQSQIVYKDILIVQ